MDSSWLDESLLTLVKEKSTDINSLVVINGKQCSQLMVACLHGKLKYIKKLLEVPRIEINKQNDEGDHALMCACRQGHSKVVQLILHPVKNPEHLVNLRDHRGWSSLMIASQNGLTETVSLLLKNGALINIQNNKGVSSLMIASHNGHVETIALLLQYGAQVNMQNNDGWSSLMIASHNGHTETVALLLHNGAQVNMQNNDGWSSLMIASQDGHTETVALLLQNSAQVNMQDNNYKRSSLMIASENGHTETVALLLQNGAQVNMQDEDGWSSLMIASQNGRTEMVVLLLQNGAQVNMQDEDGWSSLMIASHNGHTETVALLLQNAAQVNMQNNKGTFPLIVASQNGHTKTVAFLIQNGAQVNMQNNDGCSSLMIASQKGHTETVSLLLQNGADSNIKSNDGKSSLSIAKRCGHDEIISLLLQSGSCQKQTEENKILCTDEKYPGIVITKNQKIYEHLSSSAKEIDLEDDIGISIVVPEDSLPPDESVDLVIQPCFTGSFEMPEDIEPASPAYLIETNKKVELKKSFLVRIQHYANLQTEEDCNSMVFLRANSDPEYRGSKPVYIFKEVDRVEGKFTIGESQIGEIELTHFSWWRIGILRRRSGPLLYSARLYRALSSANVTAVFCMCPHLKCYTKYCDRYIARNYSGMTQKAEGCIVYNRVTIISDTITLVPGEGTKCSMDKSRILKEEIDLPETEGERVSRIPDYPPRIAITHTCAKPEPLRLSITGVDKECTFEIPASPTNYTDSAKHTYLEVDIQHLKAAKASLENQLIGMKDTPVLISVKRMIDIMNNIETLAHDPSSIQSLLNEVQQIQDQTDEIIKSTKRTMMDTKNEIEDVLVPKILSISQQLKIGAVVKLKHCADDDWHVAVDMLVTNAAELMSSIQELLKVAEIDQLKMQTLWYDDPGAKGTSIEDRILGIDDLGDVLDAVETLSAKWELLATKLRIKQHTIEAIQKNNPRDVDVCLNKALGHWLKLNYDHQKYGRPSWKTLAKSVKNLDQRVYEEIARDHPG